MRKEQEQFAFSTVFEGMTSIRAILHGKEAGVNDRTIDRILYDTAKEKKLLKDLGYLRYMGSRYGFPVEGVDAEVIDSYAIGNTHGGLIAICGARTFPHLSSPDLLPESGFFALIEGIEDPYNFGYAMRSLYACGVDGIILGTRNWMSAAGVVARASAGASEQIPLYVADVSDTIDLFKGVGYLTVAADLRTDRTLGTTPLHKPLLLIAGGEKRGISRSILDKVDLLVKIPYGREFNASLSAASAVTMFAYEIIRQNLS